MHNQQIDGGKDFDFGRVSDGYARFRDIYPDSLYEKLQKLGIGRQEQTILDLGSGTGVLPRHLYHTGARFTATDVSPNQLDAAKQLAEQQSMRMSYHVCGAEDIGLDGEAFDAVTAVQCFRYFDVSRAIPEIRRVLKPGGLFCRVDMEWLPHEDEIAARTEELILAYNPNWTGGGFAGFRYCCPDWADGRLALETVHCYREALVFTPETWRGRIQTCRGVGASLTPDAAQRFDADLAEMLMGFDTLSIRHQIQIELYRKQ